MLNPIVLRVNGNDFGGWETASVTASANEAVRTFNVTTSERRPDWPIKPQDEVEVVTFSGSGGDGDVLVKGYVDDYKASLDAESHTATISGRGKTCDIVDCSAVHETGRFEKKDIGEIANILSKRYGVKIVVKAKNLKKIERFHIQVGESVWSAVERIARSQDLMLVGGADGSLEIHDSPEELIDDALYEGEFLSIETEISAKDRHSEYKVKGQRAFSAEAPDLKIEKKAVDGSIKRIRTKIIVAEGDLDNDGAEKRAKNEKSTRQGNSIKVDIMVSGFYRPKGGLWTPMKKIYVYSPTVHIDQTMAIESCEFSKDANDKTTTKLSLVDPKALKDKSGDSRSKSDAAYKAD